MKKVRGSQASISVNSYTELSKTQLSLLGSLITTDITKLNRVSTKDFAGNEKNKLTIMTFKKINQNKHKPK